MTSVLLFFSDVFSSYEAPKGNWKPQIFGAGDGNRTHVISLEGWSSTIELHPLEGLSSERKFLDYTPVKNPCQAVFENARYFVEIY